MKSKSKQLSILDREFTVEGAVSAKGQLVVKGTIKGALTGDSVVIAEEGAVYAEADVARMTVGGKFHGYIRASKELIILSTGNCSGTIVCKHFVVEAGGQLNAEVTCMVDPEEKVEEDALHLNENGPAG
jgi:cytoskeletal protein CcmA (bactofilin family)